MLTATQISILTKLPIPIVKRRLGIFHQEKKIKAIFSDGKWYYKEPATELVKNFQESK